MYPEDNDELNGSNRSEQSNPPEDRELPPVQPRYADDIKRESTYYSEYDDSYNYADSKRNKKPKKEKGQRSMAGVMAALCVASAIGGFSADRVCSDARDCRRLQPCTIKPG